MRGWRNTFGNLIELLRLRNQIAGFIEFEISSSTSSTVFRQPLDTGHRRDRGARAGRPIMIIIVTIDIMLLALVM